MVSTTTASPRSGSTRIKRCRAHRQMRQMVDGARLAHDSSCRAHGGRQALPARFERAGRRQHRFRL